MKPGMGWPIGIACILATTVIGNLVVMRIANDDPSFAIESNYYQKAVAFDSTMDLERKSEKLGWTANAAFESDVAATRVLITLRDAQQQPVTGATVAVDAVFNARANDVVHADLRETEPGVYAAPMAVTFAGEWELRVNARHVNEHGDTSHYASSTRVTATPQNVFHPSVGSITP
ncbi:MAG: FixH family protein [Gemmatimonadaceae bacterium]